MTRITPRITVKFREGFREKARRRGFPLAAVAAIALAFASCGGSSSPNNLQTSPALVSISVEPINSNINPGTTVPMRAIGTFGGGGTLEITSTVTWTSSETNVATISNAAGSAGIATGVALGSTTITATSGTITGTTTLTVTAATLASIAVDPPSASIAVSATQPFTATGTYSDGSVQSLTDSVSWTSSDSTIATVSNTAGSQGVATGASAGTATITAASGAVSGSAVLTVNAITPTLVSIAVAPPSPSVTLGAAQQFTATGTYSDGSVQGITNTVTWSSGTASVATIGNASGTQGLATSVGTGTSTITATLGVMGSALLTVTPAPMPQAWSLHGPAGRSSHTAVWDPASQQMILFGGQSTAGADLNDVWLGMTAITEDDGFSAETPQGTPPSARHGHVAAYDSTNNRMTIFGGENGSACMNDAWILTAANGQAGTASWIGATPSGTPPAARVYSAAGYDSTSNSLIVFGGNDCSTGYFNDVWVLSNASGVSGTAAWTQLVPSGAAPAARESASVVYDPSNNVLAVYGGDAGGTPFGDVWILSNANGSGGTPVWTQLAPSGAPPMARTGQSATYDSAHDSMTIFGGINNAITLTDAWVLSSATGVGGTPGWAEIAAQGTAPSLAYHSAVFDAAGNNMYVFGGSSTQDKLESDDHAFALNGANGTAGTAKWYLGGPPVRYSESAFYDSVSGGLFVFGGQHASTNINFNDYFEASNALGSTNLQWTAVTTNGTRPSARFGHTGLYDSGSNRMMVFGGATGFPAPCMNDSYVLQQANTLGGTPTWVTVAPTGTPPAARALQASAYDSATNTLIIFGGYDCVSSYFNDIWILSDANDQSGTPAWTQLSPIGAGPSARESSTAIYDGATNSLILYGGDAGGTPFGDLWILAHANGTGGPAAWTLIPPAGGPGARSGHTATYDSVNNLMTIYGGYDGTNVLGDVWVASGANGQGGLAWSQQTSGQVRRFHSSAYDAATNQMITYGGTTGVTEQNPSSDVYTLTDANGAP
jgi:hypothetical protein